MPLFHWEAWTTAGEARQGAQSGGSEIEVVAALRRQGLRVTAVRREQQHTPTPRAERLRPEVRRWLRELLALRSLGCSTPEALARMAEGRRRRGIWTVAAVPADELDLVRQAVETGQPLGGALRRVPQRFDDLVCRVLSAGEAAGDLDGALQRLAEHAERPSPLDHALHRLARILIVGAIGLGLLLGVTTTGAAGLYTRLGVDPGLIGGWLTRSGVTIALTLALLLALGFATRTSGLRTLRDTLALRIPGLGAALRVQAAERLARALALLLAAPLPLLSALEIAAPRVGNAAIAAAVLRVQAMVARGVDLGTALADARVFSPVVTALTREAAGQLAEAMPEISGLCAAEADELAERTRRVGHVLQASFVALATLAMLALAMPLRV